MDYKTYIYGLYEDDKLVYVGKTTTPKSRLVGHKSYYSGKLHIIILDIFNDLEQVWIEKMKNEGHTLTNKESLSNADRSFNIGDKIVVNDRKYQKVFDTELDVMYESLGDFERKTGILSATLVYQLRYSSVTKECYKKYTLVN